MEVFVARQPIFTKSKGIFAYELLYRRNLDNHFSEVNGDTATTEVIINSFMNIGLDTLSNGKPCFINFTENLLNIKLPTYFNPDEIVVEILETVEISESLIQLCKDLKSKGYKIALDDFVLNRSNPYTIPLLELADIIKVDFRDTADYMKRLLENFSLKYKFKLLAEKVETLEEYELALNAGYDYFQGYFFSKPVIVSTHDIPEYIQNYFYIINQLTIKEPDVGTITQLIEQDLSLSYKLLKLINSPALRSVSKINSIRQAVVRLGFNELIKWLYILALRGNHIENSEWSKETVYSSLVRAKMCELLAKQCQLEEPSSYFLTGLFSLMDTLLSMEMEAILHLMPLQEDICDALKGSQNSLKEILDLTVAIEKADWTTCDTISKQYIISEDFVAQSYNEAFKWAINVMEN